MPIEVRPVGTGEFFPWHAAYTGYGEFYETPLHDEKAVLVWSWIIDPSHELECLVAVEQGDDGDEIVGLAHFREFARPLEGNRGIHLDDLFVLPEKRTGGVGRALIEGVYAVGRERGIAFGFVSGYSDTLDFPPDLRHVPLLNKPFDEQSMRLFVERLTAVGRSSAM